MMLNLRDNILYYLGTDVYQNSLVSDRYSKYFSWTKDREDLPTFYTHTQVRKRGQEKNRSAILIESTIMIPEYVRYVYENCELFDHIYTHNHRLLTLPNSRWIPGGGVWIGTEFGGGEYKIYDKNKICSFTSSNKSMCELHNIRLNLFRFIEKRQAGNIKENNIDLFGTAFQYAGPNNTFVKPVDYLSDYMFSVIVENYIDDYYFTEKILNCFATGTIPIYLGARKIDSVFNGDGIIKFSSAVDFLRLHKTLSKELYDSKIEAVRQNHEIAKSYVCVEDFMWENYLRYDYEYWNNSK